MSEQELRALKAAISTPEAVFINMKAGTIPKPSLRSMVDLYGEVINGEDAQLLEIARLRAEIEDLRRRPTSGFTRETFWYPMAVAASLFAVIGAIMAVIIKLLR
jgi:hypothetical protein